MTNQYSKDAEAMLTVAAAAVDDFRKAAATGMVDETEDGQREAAMSMIMTASNFLERGVLGIGYGLLAIAEEIGSSGAADREAPGGEASPPIIEHLSDSRLRVLADVVEGELARRGLRHGRPEGAWFPPTTPDSEDG